MTDTNNTIKEKRGKMEKVYNNSFDKLDTIIKKQEELIKKIISENNINPDDLYV